MNKKHGIIRIVRSGQLGPDGVDTNLTAFLAEAKRRGQKVLDVRTDEERNEHLIKVMRLREPELAALEAKTLYDGEKTGDVEDAEAPTSEQMRAMREAFDAAMSAPPPSDIERQRAKKELKRAARGPQKHMFMRVLAGEGGEARRDKAIRDARRAGIKVVDWRLDEEANHYVIRAINNQRKAKHR